QKRRKHDKSVETSTSPSARNPRLELLEALAQETQLGGIVDGAALEHAAEHDSRGVELVHVLENEDLHLARPERHVRGARVLLQGGSVAPGERQIAQAVLGEERGVREPRPSAVGVDEKLLVREVEREACARGIRALAEDPCGEEKRVLAARLELE